MNVQKQRDGSFEIPIFFDPNEALSSLNLALQNHFEDNVKVRSVVFNTLTSCSDFPEVYARREELTASGMVVYGSILVPKGFLGLADYMGALLDAGAKLKGSGVTALS